MIELLSRDTFMDEECEEKIRYDKCGGDRRHKLRKIKAVMLGHAVGDALGVAVEFCEREVNFPQ